MAHHDDQSNGSKSADLLLSVVAHDLRGPLQTVVMGIALLIERGRLDETDLRTAARVSSGAARMHRMIDQLLDLARIRAGEPLPVERQPTDLVAVVRQIVSDLETAHPGRSFRVVEATDAHGLWDPDRIAQVVANLVGNANTYAAHGTRVNVTVVGEPGDPEVSILVANEGPAIPAHVLDTLFEPFHRGVTRGSAGLGLGLYIARTIVDAHGGWINVKSRAGERTTFEVMLPRVGERSAHSRDA